MPTVSVIIPVKDDATALARCLDALARQSVSPDEVIVVDDGSVDDSAAVARAHGARVVRCIGSGIPAASATGYDAATGDICARLDADCVAGSDWVERIAARFEDDELTGLTGFARFIDGPWLLRGILIVLYLGAYFVVVPAALGHVPLFGSNMALRRSVWLAVRDSVHRDDLLVHDDMDLSFHVGPERSIRFDRRLRMGISMRPFKSPRLFVLRLRRGQHSILVHWPQQLPWVRWTRRLHPRQVVR